MFQYQLITSLSTTTTITTTATIVVVSSKQYYSVSQKNPPTLRACGFLTFFSQTVENF